MKQDKIYPWVVGETNKETDEWDNYECVGVKQRHVTVARSKGTEGKASWRRENWNQRSEQLKGPRHVRSREDSQQRKPQK